MSDPLDIDDTVEVVEQDFNEAAQFLQSIVAELDEAVLLEFYGLYKQATVGKCDTPKPGIFSIKAKTKWNAWNRLGDMTKANAMIIYVNKMSSLKPEWQNTAANSSKKKQGQWMSVSQPQIMPEDADLEDVAEADKTCFDYVKDGNVEKLLEMLDACATNATKPHLSAKDELGLALIHWAADRGNKIILEVLLQHGVDVNAVDMEGQTALHYAASVGHVECVEILLKFYADRTIKDVDGHTCVDVAESVAIADLLRD